MSQRRSSRQLPARPALWTRAIAAVSALVLLAACDSGSGPAATDAATPRSGATLTFAYSTRLANTYRLRASNLDTVLDDQAATADTAKRQQLVTQAQRLIAQNGYAIPVVELTTELGVAAGVHNLGFEASSRIQLHDTWKS